MKHVDSKLHDACLKFLDPGERLQGAFVVARGFRPGIEISALPVALVFSFISPLLAFVLAMAVATSINLFGRTALTIALTNEKLLIMKNARGTWRRPSALVESTTFPVQMTVPDPLAGDKTIEINGHRYWLLDRDLDEARRVARLVHQGGQF